MTNASDDEWWQAKKLIGDAVDQGLGIIPGKKRYLLVQYLMLFCFVLCLINAVLFHV